AAFTQGAPVKANDGGVAKVGIDAIKAGGIGHGHVAVVGPGHGLRHHHLLFLGGVHVALAAHDELGAPHGAVAPDLRIVAVVTDDQADFHPLRPFADVGAVAGIPAFNGTPGNAFAVFLHHLALVV